MLIGLIRTIFFLTIFYYIFKFVIKYLLPYFLGKLMGQTQNQNNKNFQKKKNEGEITIDYVPKKTKKISNDTGEYIEYEEVKK